MANPIIKILRGHTAPPTLEAGRIAIDQTNKNLYVGISDGNGGTINEIVGGSGTFATKQYVTDAVSAGTGSLGTMSTQDADSVAITGGAIDGTAIGLTTPSTGAFTTLTVSTAPSGSNDAVRKTDLDSAISALGGVFHFVGDVSLATSNDLDTLSDTATGAYYKVDVAGTYTSGGNSFEAKVGDAFVKTTTGWQKLDNVDAEVFGTANEIAVTGDENAGYTVAIDPVFSGRVSDVESKTQNIDLAATTAGNTQINGSFTVGSFTVDDGSGPMLNVSPSSLVLNMNMGTQTVQSWSTFQVKSMMGLEDNGTIALDVDGHLVGNVNGFNGTVPEIRGFVIDGGEY